MTTHKAPVTKVKKSVAAITVAGLSLGLLLSGPLSALAIAPHGGGDEGRSLITYDVNGNSVLCTDWGRNSDPVAASTSLVSSPHMSYLLTKYIGTTFQQNPNSDQVAAIAWLNHTSTEVPHNDLSGGPYGDVPSFSSLSAAEQAQVTSLQAETQKFAGPYTVANSVSETAPNSGIYTATFTVKSGSGAGVPNVNVNFARTGATTNISATSGTTDGSGNVTVSYTLNPGTTGGVGATATALAGDSVILNVPADPNGYQRMIGTGPTESVPSSVSTTRGVNEGGFRIYKIDGQTNQPLGGATFNIHSGSPTGPVVADVATDSSGYSHGGTYVPLPAGNYFAVEVGTPPGYQTATPVAFTVGTGNITVSISDNEQSEVSLHKIDGGTGGGLANVGVTATVGGAVVATGTTDAAGNWTSPELNILPNTTVVISETTTPPGYVTAAPVTVTSSGDGSGAGRAVMNDSRVFGPISVKKTDKETGAPLANTGFSLSVRKLVNGSLGAPQPVTGGVTYGTETTPGNYVTGALGLVKVDGATSTPKLAYGDQFTWTETSAPARYVLPSPAPSATASVGAASTPDVSVPDQPVGTLTFAKNVTNADGSSAPHPVLSGATYSITDTTTNTLITAKSDPTDASGMIRVDLGNSMVGDTIALIEQTSAGQAGLDQTPITGVVVVNADGSVGLSLHQTDRLIAIHTTARGPAGNRYIGAAGGVVLDAVDYTAGLTPGVPVTMSASMIDQAGKVVASGSRTFTPTNTDRGTVVVPVTVPASAVGRRLTVLETLGKANAPSGTAPIATETTDAAQVVEQTIGQVNVTTNVANADSSRGQIVDATHLNVIDIAHVSGVLAGDTITISGTGVRHNADGTTTPIKATGIATATANGSLSQDIPVKFTLTSADIVPGTTVTFQEIVTINGNVVAVNTSTTDRGETVYYPLAATTAHDSVNTTSHEITTKLVDDIRVSGLVPGGSYTANGVLQIVAANGTSKASTVTGSTKFVATGTSQLVPVTFDVSTLPGAELVPFESILDVHGNVVAVHQDVTDKNQQAFVPKIGTIAANGNSTLGKTVTAGSLTDTIAFSGMQPGVLHTWSGQFYAKSSQGLVATGIIGKVDFTPTTTSGTVVVKFPISADQVAYWAAFDLVAFEDVTVAGKVVATHHDGSSASQTVHVPAVATTLLGSSGTHTAASGTDTLTDTLSYTNLPVGVPLVANGVLINSSNGQATTILGSTPFVATTSSGKVNVTFHLDGNEGNLNEVAFESITQGGIEIAAHKVITSADQTVYVPSAGNGGAASIPTGNGAGNTTWIWLAIGSILAGLVTFRRKIIAIFARTNTADGE